MPFDYLCVGLVYFYKIFISPLKPKTCRYYPSCSTFMIQAILEFHLIKGILLGLKRLLKCSPRFKGGYDPIPHNIRGKFKNLI